MKLNGAQILIQEIMNQGVDTIFGYPGGQVLPIYDALFDADIRHILTRHEQGAVHAADGYARASGKPGVCLATSGPGATNLVTGIANAYMDSVPLVAITGQVSCALLGRDSFQEADITGITMPITKHNYIVKDISELSQIIKESFYIATTGRPGPVLIDIPKDVSSAEFESRGCLPVNLPGYRPVLEGREDQLARAAEAIMSAQKPVICAGGGVVSSGGHEELLAFAELLKSPVTLTLMGLGGFPGDHPLYMGMLGMHGSRASNYAVCAADLLINVGARFDDRVTGKIELFAPNARIVHIDIDPAEIGKNVRADIDIVGDVRAVLKQLMPRLKEKAAGEWQEQVEKWKKDYPMHFENVTGTLKPQQVIREIYDVTGGRARITTDVGQHQMWAAQHYVYARPRTFISSGGLGTMGYGFPAAIGVQVACPDETVFCITGDGSIQMNIQELATAVHNRLPVKVAILNNGYLGMIRQWQELFYNRRYSQSELFNPDFVKLASAYGALGLRAERAQDVRPALDEALRYDGPVLIDFVIEREENVLPIVPPGECLHNMIG